MNHEPWRPGALTLTLVLRVLKLSTRPQYTQYYGQSTIYSDFP